MSRNPIKLIPADFTAVPALANACDAAAVDHFAADLDAVALLVAAMVAGTLATVGRPPRGSTPAPAAAWWWRKTGTHSCWSASGTRLN